MTALSDVMKRGRACALCMSVAAKGCAIAGYPLCARCRECVAELARANGTPIGDGPIPRLDASPCLARQDKRCRDCDRPFRPHCGAQRRCDRCRAALAQHRERRVVGSPKSAETRARMAEGQRRAWARRREAALR